MSGERSLIDANVLVYALYANAEQHTACRNLLGTATHSDAGLCVTSQVLAEFFSIVTNPKRVSDPRLPEEAIQAVEAILSLPGISVLSTPPDTPARWLELLRSHPVRGPAVYDVHLVATMQANDVRRIYTYNGADFAVFSDLEVVLP